MNFQIKNILFHNHYNTHRQNQYETTTLIPEQMMPFILIMPDACELEITQGFLKSMEANSLMGDSIRWDQGWFMDLSS